MSDFRLVSFNTVRPVGPFSIEREEIIFFLSELPAIFVDASVYDGMAWHEHGVRLEEGRFAPFDEVAKLKTDGTGNPNIVTMAGWTGVEAMHAFAYRDSRRHVDAMRRLRGFVDRTEGPTLALWWARRDQHVTLDEGWRRLTTLREHGPTPDAFSLQIRFDPQGGAELAA